MRRREVGFFVGAVAVWLLVPALLWAIVRPGGTALAEGPNDDAYDAMHAACQSGDVNGMLGAMRTALDDDAYNDMLNHMNSIHPDWQSHMGSMHRGGSGSAGMMGGGMMGGSPGGGFGGMMGGR